MVARRFGSAKPRTHFSDAFVGYFAAYLPPSRPEDWAESTAAERTEANAEPQGQHAGDSLAHEHHQRRGVAL